MVELCRSMREEFTRGRSQDVVKLKNVWDSDWLGRGPDTRQENRIGSEPAIDVEQKV